MQGKNSRRGLSGQGAPRTDTALGRVDPASELAGQIYVDDRGEVFDVMLNLVDVEKNHDKYFILQVRPAHTKAHPTHQHIVYLEDANLVHIATWRSAKRAPHITYRRVRSDR